MNLNHLNLTDGYVYSVSAAGYDDILPAFNKANLIGAYRIIKDFVKLNGINPGHENSCLDAIRQYITTATSDSGSAVFVLPLFSGAPGVGILPDVCGLRKRRKLVNVRGARGGGFKSR